MAPVLHIRLLGDCSLCYDGAPAVTEVNTPRLQSLLAYLLLNRDALSRLSIDGQTSQEVP